MSYQAQQVVSQNEIRLNDWHKRLVNLLDGICGLEIIYYGPVTGLSHHKYSEHADLIREGNYLGIRADPLNKYDPNATGLFFGNQQIGWVPKAMNSVCAKALRYNCTLSAKVTKHTKFCGDFTNILFVEITATRTNSDTPNLRIPASDTIFHSDWAKNIAPNIKSQEPIMAEAKSKTSALIEKNVTLGTNAAFLEAGRIANNQLSSIAGKKLPIMVRAYADTAVGRLLLANIAVMAAEHFRPEDNRLRKLVEAMTISSYQEVLQTFDIEQMIEDLVSNKTIAKALKAVDVESA